MKKKISNVAVELTTCGDSGEYGGIVWFGTHSEKSAKQKLKKLAAEISDLRLKKFPRTMD